ncbi:hypothetical protein DCAR_0933937 [Daucus carota subsp. sativus]|uniref:Uncharacterized protein n=1 Tax=Daucus carota subsp. sativus TaxID=79200 RepID=A0A175YF97_DAUCS|nr:hypothetical protein DCAR_0933937 [Daucus carota subsp. sativus]
MSSETLLGRDLEVLESIRKHLLDDPDVSDSFPAIIPSNNPIWEWDTNFSNFFVEESSSVKLISFDQENNGKSDIGDDHGREEDLKQHAGVKKRSRNYCVEKKRPAKNGPTMWLEKCNKSDGSLAYDGTTVRFCGSGTK